MMNMIVGDPAAGKTYSLLTALLELGIPTHVADFDADVDGYRMGGRFREFPPETQDLLTSVTLLDKVKLTKGNATVNANRKDQQTVPKAKISPDALKGWMELKDEWAELPANHAVVIDSGTNFTEAMVNYHLALNAKGQTEIAMQDYGTWYQLEKALVGELRGFRPMVWMTYHLQHLSLANMATADQEKAGNVKAPDLAGAMAVTETRWPSTAGRKSAREKPLTKHFGNIVKIEVRGKKRVLLSEPDDDTLFLHSHVAVHRADPVDGLRKMLEVQHGQN